MKSCCSHPFSYPYIYSLFIDVCYFVILIFRGAGYVNGIVILSETKNLFKHSTIFITTPCRNIISNFTGLADLEIRASDVYQPPRPAGTPPMEGNLPTID